MFVLFSYHFQRGLLLTLVLGRIFLFSAWILSFCYMCRISRAQFYLYLWFAICTEYHIPILFIITDLYIQCQRFNFCFQIYRSDCGSADREKDSLQYYN